MSGLGALEQAREAFHAQAWEPAFAGFAAADRDHGLDPPDLELHARAAFLVGRDDVCVAQLERAYHRWLEDGHRDQAAECAFWLAFNLMNRGEVAQAGGWLARVEQTAEDPDSTARGLLLVPAALQALMSGDAESALTRFTEAREVGQRTGDPQLLALGGLGAGQAMIALGDIEGGLARLDEVMVSVTTGEVSPIVSGLVYCAVIIACHETYHLRRAAEWTRALSRWCDPQPDLVPFRGQCLVHRAQILLLSGAWQDAQEQVHLARRRLSDPPGQPAVGMALYEQGELHRLRGELAAAEAAYRQASDFGHETQPGLALLRLAQGKLDAACAGIERALEESPLPTQRPRLLAAYVEIALAAGRVDRARAAADELAGLVEGSDATLLRAMSAQATGAVLLEEGDARAALVELRRAWSHWQELGAPYLAARVRLLRGRCCRELGDQDAARMELESAGRVFHALGARPDLDVLHRMGVRRPAADGPLTLREVQVLRSVATGKTNRAVAEELFLSEKTVARHLSNIFTKLDVSSRAAATAYAYEHDLV